MRSYSQDSSQPYLECSGFGAHVALRGIAAGQELRLDKNLIRSGMREEAERLCTRALGYRTSGDIAQAQRQEIGFARPTLLDRHIERRSWGIATAT